MNYREAISYLESAVNYERIPAYPYKESFKLERIKDFLQIIGNPQDCLRAVHVAGSKGKGSTCIFIAYILRQAGYNVGLYTSPHLADFRERIRILRRTDATPPRRIHNDFEGMINRRDLTVLIKRLKPQIDKYNEVSQYGPLTFFEIYTALAFIYFKEKKTDFIVLETGLGGRLDATNVVKPLVCVITPVSLEHTDKLGKTLKEIALEKAGIIKRGVAVVCASQEKVVLGVIRDKCKEIKAKLYEFGRDIIYKKTGDSFVVAGLSDNYEGLRINLLGEHQFMNSAVAIGAVELLSKQGVKIDPESIRNGLNAAVWPGRCEVISRSPWVVLDGAQNSASTSVLAKALKSNFKYKRLILVFGVSSDKDIKGICRILSGLSDIIILTRADNPRAADPKQLGGYFKGKRLYSTESVSQAKAISLRVARKSDLILVCGSLFVVGEFR